MHYRGGDPCFGERDCGVGSGVAGVEGDWGLGGRFKVRCYLLC